ncbi:uncharacterized protein BP5553_04683 [Venustampulla echinocandica]|uniref:ORC6 first cyclin-like domain-containing protein n=1 Tax=Venustampulla echinocandica TaxID=2656787 RepID=A0A370TP08_9HELO|nr:uncharacterized protein BP5553_04683 [Venustampulla echinocandica]RDL37250.1 hypothetical protein BP5553_04683 [Venustampulla echinocandica]
MSKPVEQALSNLIPRHPGALPPELIDLARSLLAQSRAKVSNLKAEEEIGRTLKTTLNLPPIEPRPPIPPRVYNKLYIYFNTLLPASTSRRKSRNNTASALSTSSKPNDLPEKQTPIKPNTPSRFSKNRVPKSGLQYGNEKQRDERVPKWVPPVVRKLCAEMDTQTAIPHVLAGVESILCLPLAKRSGTKLPALVAAVWFFVIQELTGKNISKREFTQRRTRVLEVFSSLREDEEIIEKIGDGEEVWGSWEDVGFADVQAWIVEVTQGDWLEMDWFVNIGSSGDDGDAMDVDGEEEDQDIDDMSAPRRNQMGMGRMMQDEYDYLSAENQEEYAEWREIMLSTIDDLIKEGIMNMDPPDS